MSRRIARVLGGGRPRQLRRIAQVQSSRNRGSASTLPSTSSAGHRVAVYPRQRARPGWVTAAEANQDAWRELVRLIRGRADVPPFSDGGRRVSRDRATGRKGPLSHARSAYAAYRAYSAYVDFGMSMRLRHNRKTGRQRVLHKNMGFPTTEKYQDPYFLGNLKVYRSNPCGQAHQQLQRNFRLSCLPRSMT